MKPQVNKPAVKKLVLTKSGQISKNITNMIGNCTFDDHTLKIYVGYYSGSARFTSSHSALLDVTNLLDAAGYKYETGNDAPKGGIKGDFVKVKSRKAFNFVNSFNPYPDYY